MSHDSKEKRRKELNVVKKERNRRRERERGEKRENENLELAAAWSGAIKPKGSERV